MRKVKGKSGILGWKTRLQKNYDSFDEFEHYSEIYAIHSRLGFHSAEEAWDANPIIKGSVIASDLQVVK